MTQRLNSSSDAKPTTRNLTDLLLETKTIHSSRKGGQKSYHPQPIIPPVPEVSQQSSNLQPSERRSKPPKQTTSPQNLNENHPNFKFQPSSLIPRNLFLPISASNRGHNIPVSDLISILFRPDPLYPRSSSQLRTYLPTRTFTNSERPRPLSSQSRPINALPSPQQLRLL